MLCSLALSMTFPRSSLSTLNAMRALCIVSCELQLFKSFCVPSIRSRWSIRRRRNVWSLVWEGSCNIVGQGLVVGPGLAWCLILRLCVVGYWKQLIMDESVRIRESKRGVFYTGLLPKMWWDLEDMHFPNYHSSISKNLLFRE